MSIQYEVFLKKEIIDYMGAKEADKTLTVKTTKDLWTGELVTNIQSGHNVQGARITQIGNFPTMPALICLRRWKTYLCLSKARHQKTNGD